MNIYKTKSGNYINVDLIKFTELSFDDDPEHPSIKIFFGNSDAVILRGNTAKSFIDYLDYHLDTVYTGWA